MKSKSPRGLQDVRTMSDRTGEADNRQRKYLALAMLELEKVRRTKEKRIASQRVEDAHQRLAEIEDEQARLLAVAQTERAESSLGERSAPVGHPESRAQQGFRLSY